MFVELRGHFLNTLCIPDALRQRSSRLSAQSLVCELPFKVWEMLLIGWLFGLNVPRWRHVQRRGLTARQAAERPPRRALLILPRLDSARTQCFFWECEISVCGRYTSYCGISPIQNIQIDRWSDKVPIIIKLSNWPRWDLQSFASCQSGPRT